MGVDDLSDELEAMATIETVIDQIGSVLIRLDANERERVVSWLIDRLRHQSFVRSQRIDGQ